MPRTIGYTPARAAQLKERITLDCMRIEAQLLGMVSRVTDVSVTSFSCEAPETVLERVREIAAELDEVIDRRTHA